ncbi:MAG: tRNA pseudouridine(55) synthase TruB [Candidatus Eisenbacteria bacterium]|nr:tRNA pseudouridine(55) synthase TruB [Candidatus Eisenbacteria bacterium]
MAGPARPTDRFAGEWLLALDKPEGPTSRALVDRVVRRLGRRDIGHAGTLDPFATGLLLVLIGRATRLVPWIQEWPKSYRAVVRFGSSTDTLDGTGRVLMTAQVPDDLVRFLPPAIASLTGAIQQAPPMVSAARFGGRRLHELAREGKTVERVARERIVHAMRLVDVRLPDVELEVTCSSGTYVRVLAESLGEALGVPAHLNSLRRTAIGPHGIGTALDGNELDSIERDRLASRLLPLPAILADWPARLATPEETIDIGHGRIPGPWDDPSNDAGPDRFQLLAESGSLLALIERLDGRHRFLRVFSPAEPA